MDAVQAPVSYWPPPQVVHAEQTRSLLPPQAPVSWLPAAQAEQVEQMVSVVGLHEAVR